MKFCVGVMGTDGPGCSLSKRFTCRVIKILVLKQSLHSGEGGIKHLGIFKNNSIEILCGPQEIKV